MKMRRITRRETMKRSNLAKRPPRKVQNRSLKSLQTKSRKMSTWQMNKKMLMMTSSSERHLHHIIPVRTKPRLMKSRKLPSPALVAERQPGKPLLANVNQLRKKWKRSISQLLTKSRAETSLSVNWQTTTCMTVTMVSTIMLRTRRWKKLILT